MKSALIEQPIQLCVVIVFPEGSVVYISPSIHNRNNQMAPTKPPGLGSDPSSVVGMEPVRSN